MRALIIVDIQDQYKNYLNSDYIENVKKFISFYNKDDIYVLIDTHNEEGEFIPDFLTNYKKIYKNYSMDYSKRNLNKVDIDQIKTLNPTFEIKKENLENGAIIYGRKNNQPFIDFIDSSFCDFGNTLSNYDTVDILGGIKNRCIKKTEILLHPFNNNINILDNLCFSKNDYSNKLPHISWKYVFNTNEELKNFLKEK